MPKNKRAPRGGGSVFWSDSKGCWIGRAIVGTKPNGNPLHRECTGRTQAEALRKKRLAEDAARAGVLSGGNSSLTVGDYLEHWLQNTSKPSVEITTWTSYERCVRLHLKPRIGGIKLREFRPTNVEKLFADMQRDEVSGGNAKKVSEVLSSALEHAARIGLIPFNPAAPIPKPKTAGEQIVPFDKSEVKRILMASADHKLEALLALAIGTGMRQGELFGLGWEHVDFDRGTVRVVRSLAQAAVKFYLKEPKSKNGKRVIDVPEFALAPLRRLRDSDRAPEERRAEVIFCTRTGGFISKSSFIRQVWQPLLETAGVTYRKFHTLRHTHISELLSARVPVVEVARRVGDRPEVILKTYAHWLPGTDSGIGQQLDVMYA
jgi:integrase